MFEQEQINEYIIRFIGSANLAKELTDKDITILVHGSILKVEDEDNQDGTKNRVFKCKLIDAEQQ